jgi:hypothetical protein
MLLIRSAKGRHTVHLAREQWVLGRIYAQAAVPAMRERRRRVQAAVRVSGAEAGVKW